MVSKTKDKKVDPRNACSYGKKWAEWEEEILIQAVYSLDNKSLDDIAKNLPWRNIAQCQGHYAYLRKKNPTLRVFKNHRWTPEEDQRLIEFYALRLGESK